MIDLHIYSTYSDGTFSIKENYKKHFFAKCLTNEEKWCKVY